MVANAPLTATVLAVQANEQAKFSGTVASFSDKDPGGALGDYSATIDWGNGARRRAWSRPASAVSWSMAYTRIWRGEITASPFRSRMKAARTSRPMARPMSSTCPWWPRRRRSRRRKATLCNAKVATFTDADRAATPGIYVVTIAWGDGTTSGGTVSGPTGGPFIVKGSHVFADEGNAPSPFKSSTRAGVRPRPIAWR